MLGHRWRPFRKRHTLRVCGFARSAARRIRSWRASAWGAGRGSTVGPTGSGGSSRQCSSAASRARRRWASASTPGSSSPHAPLLRRDAGGDRATRHRREVHRRHGRRDLQGAGRARDDAFARCRRRRRCKSARRAWRGVRAWLRPRHQPPIGVNTGEVVTGEVEHRQADGDGRPGQQRRRAPRAGREGPGDPRRRADAPAHTRRGVLRAVEASRSRESQSRSPPISCAPWRTTGRPTPGGATSSSSTERRSSRH